MVNSSCCDDAGDVFKEHDSRLAFLNDSRHFGPKVSLILCAKAAAGATERLARESRSEDINVSAPASPIEGAGIIENRRGPYERFFHPIHEGPRGACFPFDVTHNVGVESDAPEGGDDTFPEHSSPGANLKHRDRSGM